MTSKHPLSGTSDTSPAKRPCFGIGDSIAATEVPHENQFLAQEKLKEEKSEEDKRFEYPLQAPAADDANKSIEKRRTTNKVFLSFHRRSET